jgi:hypothetical protein
MFIFSIFTKISVKIYVWYILCGPSIDMLTLSSSSTKIQQVINFEVVLYIAKEQGHIKFIKKH